MTARARRAPVRAAVLGADVSRSRSPVIHQAAYAALGIPGEYRAISVPAPAFSSTVRALFADGYRYVNVTIPHKLRAARLAVTRSRAVALTGAANTLIARRAGLHAENTDGDGLIAALAELGAPVTRGMPVLLLGAGGAAAGALLALVRRGAQVTLLARRPAQAAALRRRLPEPLRARVRAAALTPARLGAAAASCRLVVSAVPAAAWADAELADALAAALPRAAAISEMAYGAPSPLAALARRRRLRYQDGLPMLVHQAARAVQLALRRTPPIAPMAAAARRGLT